MTQPPNTLAPASPATPPSAASAPPADAAPAPAPTAAGALRPETPFAPLTTAVWWRGIAAILALVLVAYFPILRGGDFIHEDYARLTAAYAAPGQPPANSGATWVKPRPTLREAPLTYVMLQAEWRLFGANPAGYHIVSLALHAATAAAVWLLLRRLHVHGAWLAGALVAVHPALAEAVGWISARGNVLALLFFVLALGQFVRAFRLDETPPNDLPTPPANSSLRLGSLLLTFLLLAAALASAPAVACTLPLAFPLVLWWRRGRLSPAVVTATLLLLLAGVVAGGAAFGPWGRPALDLGVAAPLTWGQRAAIAERAAGIYVGKLFWPLHLTFLYPKWEAVSRIQDIAPAAAAVVMALWGLFLARRWLGRGLAAGAAFYVAALLPVLGLWDVNPLRVTFAAEHWGYVAAAGMLVLVAAVAGRAMRLLEGADRWMGLSAVVPVVGVLCFLTFLRSQLLANPLALWDEAAARPGASYVAHDELGNLLRVKAARATTAAEREHLIERAVGQYRTAIELNPEYARPYNSLGQIYQERGKYKEALDILSNGRFLNSDDPVTIVSLANVICTLGKYSSARGYLEPVLESYPNYAEAHLAMGTALRGEGDYVRAIRHFQRAIELQPSNAVPHNEYGVVLMAQGKFDEAKREFTRALDLNASYVEAHNNLGICLVRTDMRPLIEAAVEHYKAALRLRPEFSEAHKNMAVAYQALGETKKAIDELKRVQEANPRDPENLAALAELLATAPDRELRDVALAVKLADKAVDLTFERDAMLLAVAARVHGAAEQYSTGVDLAIKALTLATTDGNQAQAQAFQALLEELERGARQAATSGPATRPQ